MRTIHIKSLQLNDKGVPQRSSNWRRRESLTLLKLLQSVSCLIYKKLCGSHCVCGSGSAPLGGPGVTCASCEQVTPPPPLAPSSRSEVMLWGNSELGSFTCVVFQQLLWLMLCPHNSPSHQKAGLCLAAIAFWTGTQNKNTHHLR